MDVSVSSLVPIALAGVAAGVAAFASHVARHASGPRLVAKVAELETRVAAAELTVSNQRTAWTTFQSELAGLLEAIEDQVEVVEHKRRRAASAAARARPAEEPSTGDVLADLRRRARANGLPV